MCKRVQSAIYTLGGYDFADVNHLPDPRWASWNLGVFICIRCSGIHRGMGTHISRVKSVDLDSWTDEQLQSVLSWGNARANKYWEAKLAPGHAPSEAKIENFIRTKYELKRWSMDGPRPDPSTLDADGDDDVPLSVVKEKQAIDRSESVRKGSGAAPRPAPQPAVDLFGDDTAPARSSSTGPSLVNKVPPKAEPAPPKATSTKDSLLGLDFLGGGSAAPPRPASTTGVSSPGAQSRPDLKQSILSLYASAPKPQAQPQHQSQGSFGGMTSPQMGHQHQGSSGGFGDAFSNLSLSGGPPAPPKPADPFASLGSARPAPQPSNNAFGGLGGGSFFDAKPAQPTTTHQQKQSNSGFGDFGAFASPSPPVQSKPAQSSSMGDLFDLTSPVTTASPPPQAQAPPQQSSSSVFNLSAPQSAPAQSQPASKPAPAFNASANISGADVWGSSDWATPAPAAAPSQPKPAAPTTSASGDFGWGASGGSFASTPIVPGAGGGFNPAPKVSADEEFGGWSSGPTSTTTSKPAGGFGGEGSDDLFSNVWQ